jgi:MFS-type transporter involved in bile tolerance (Atg22 family)
MNRKSFLTLVSAIAMLVGTVALLLPAALLDSKGVAPNAAASVWAREVGIALISIALIAFSVKGHPDSPTMKAFLMGNAVLQLGLFPIEIMAFANGTLTKLSGIVPNSLLHLGLAAAFVYYAARVQAPPP